MDFSREQKANYLENYSMQGVGLGKKVGRWCVTERQKWCGVVLGRGGEGSGGALNKRKPYNAAQHGIIQQLDSHMSSMCQAEPVSSCAGPRPNATSLTAPPSPAAAAAAAAASAAV